MTCWPLSTGDGPWAPGSLATGSVAADQ